MARLTLNRKLWLTLVTVWVGLLVLTALGAWETHRLLVRDRQAQLVTVTDEAMALVKHYHDLATAGTLSDADARQQAAQAVGLLRYGTDGYLSINDTRSVMVMHPIKPELNGKDMSGFRSANGQALFQDLTRVGLDHPDGGFLDYVWPKPGSSEAVAKMGYVRQFQPWGWCLVTGAYLDDLNAAFREVMVRWLGMSLVLGVLVSAIVVLIVRNIRRSMGGDLEVAIAVAHRIAGGDLTGSVTATGDNPESLLAVLGDMQASLVTTVQKVRQGTEAIHTGAREIAAGNHDLSQRTEEQASALAETAASMEQLSATVSNNAEQAGEAVRLAQQALSATGQGEGAVGTLRERMEQIAGSSKKIGDILTVIDGIAFQTNILALNAAVEAARAGEQGRGFAVVAGEVRTLAQRSASAAKEIKALIQESEASVNAGVSAMDGARTSMTDIGASIRKVSVMIEGIASASAEQRQGIGQVSTAVGQMDQVTQQNAALVEEAAAASSSLEDQAHHLADAVAFLKV